MAELPRIDWGDTNWSDVEGYVAEHPNEGFNWSQFWDAVLWFGEPPDKLYRDAKPFVQAHVGAPIGRLGDEMASDFTGAVRGVADQAAREAGGAVQDTWSAVAPYIAAGAGVLLIYAVVKAR